MNAPTSIMEYLETLQYEGKLEKWCGDLVRFLKEEEVTVRFAYARFFSVCSHPVFVGYGAAGQRGLRSDCLACGDQIWLQRVLQGALCRCCTLAFPCALRASCRKHWRSGKVRLPAAPRTEVSSKTFLQASVVALVQCAVCGFVCARCRRHGVKRFTKSIAWAHWQASQRASPC